MLQDTFFTGLEPSLQVEVISRHPQTLEECMREAQLVNDINLALKLAKAEWSIKEERVHARIKATMRKINQGRLNLR